MGMIANEIDELIKTDFQSIRKLANEDAILFFNDLQKKYQLLSTKNTSNIPKFWEQLINNKFMVSAIQDSFGWKEAPKKLLNYPCFLFFDRHQESNVYEIENADVLSKFLGETSGFVFYLTDLSLTEIVCFSFNDVLYKFEISCPLKPAKSKENHRDQSH